MDMDSKMTNKVHKCDVCGKTFSKSKGLAGHRLTHRGECPHVCVFCDKRFYVRSNLTAHLRIHTGQKPFECDICKKSFTQNGQLKQHQRIHSGELPYKCGSCNKAFRNSSALVTHLRTHTGEKPYRCEVCSRSFTTSTSLKTHRVTHSGEMLYDCPMCKRQFNRRNNLNVHIKRHNKDRSFSCPLCHNGFVMRAHLLVHLKRSHKIDYKSMDIKDLDSLFSSVKSDSFERQVENLELRHNSIHQTSKLLRLSSKQVGRSESSNDSNFGAQIVNRSEIKLETDDCGSFVMEAVQSLDNCDTEVEVGEENVEIKEENSDIRLSGDILANETQLVVRDFEAKQENTETLIDDAVKLGSDLKAGKGESYKVVLACIKQEPLDFEPEGRFNTCDKESILVQQGSIKTEPLDFVEH